LLVPDRIILSHRPRIILKYFITIMSKNIESDPPSQCVGPSYREEKPTATVSTAVAAENVHVLPQTPQLIALLTQVHSASTGLEQMLI
jgi:hypothetical protein